MCDYFSMSSVFWLFWSLNLVFEIHYINLFFKIDFFQFFFIIFFFFDAIISTFILQSFKNEIVFVFCLRCGTEVLKYQKEKEKNESFGDVFRLFSYFSDFFFLFYFIFFFVSLIIINQHILTEEHKLLSHSVACCSIWGINNKTFSCFNLQLNYWIVLVETTRTWRNNVK